MSRLGPEALPGALPAERRPPLPAKRAFAAGRSPAGALRPSVRWPSAHADEGRHHPRPHDADEVPHHTRVWRRGSGELLPLTRRSSRPWSFASCGGRRRNPIQWAPVCKSAFKESQTLAGCSTFVFGEDNVAALSFASHPLESGMMPAWASSFGDSVYGPWAGIRVGEVEWNFQWIPAGAFMMGAGEKEPDEWALGYSERPQHRVTFSQGFWMAETPCTQAMWVVVMGEDHNPARFVDPERPVEHVRWEDVQAFIERLNARVLGLQARLPTEAEWEYACRAGTTTATYAGELNLRGENDAPVLDRIAWYGGNSGRDFDLKEGHDSSEWPEKQYDHSMAGTRQVAARLPNAWGLHDMLGNVWEWCQDWYGDYDSGSVIDPIGPDMGTRRVLRGGSWYDSARVVRAATRDVFGPSSRDINVGFRLFQGPE